jgi:hypothetical protein
MAATVATMSVSSGVSGAAVLVGGCLTVLVVGDDDRYGCPSHDVQVPGRSLMAVGSACTPNSS